MIANLDNFIDKIQSDIGNSDEPICTVIQSIMDTLICEGLRKSEDDGNEVREQYYTLSLIRDAFKEVEQED